MRISHPFLSLVLFTVVSAALAASAKDFRVSSAAELAGITKEIRAGDTVILKDGDWTGQLLVLTGQGTVEKPVAFRAESPGKVRLTGKSSLIINGQNVIVSGLLLEGGQGPGDAIKLLGERCRLTETAMVGGDYKFFVHLHGTENRLDHCYLAGKTNDSPTLQIEVEGKPNRHLIDHNHFGPRPPLGRNGGETMRVGYSHQSMTNSGTVVERNLFERCDGEIEIISNKSCENVYRCNTFRDCAGMLTLRHGNRCIVEGNFFLGHHKRGSGGIRIIGEDHVVINNYIEGVTQGGFWITSGIPDSPLTGYFQARRCLIAFNTFVDSPGPCLDLSAGFGASGRTLRPESITIANNLFAPTSGKLEKGEEGEKYRWVGNAVSMPAGTSPERPGVRPMDLKLNRGKDGLWRPGAESPIRRAAEGEYPMVRIDIDGQERTVPADVGCDQISTSPASNHPLAPEEVGPSWMLPPRR